MQNLKKVFWRELAFSLTIAALVYACVFIITVLIASLHVPSSYEGTSFICSPRDPPLLSAQEKEWAKLTGVASYHIGSDVYVDYSVPSTYWED